MRPLCVFATLLVAWLMTTSIVLAQEAPELSDNEARARELFSAGRAALDVGRPEQARELLAESLAMAPNAGTAFNLSLVHLELEQMMEANALLQRLLGGEFGPIADAQREIVESKLALSREGIAQVRIVLDGGATSIELTIDGEAMGNAESGQEFTLDAGVHSFVGRDGSAAAEVERDLAGGAMTDLRLHPIDEVAVRLELEQREESRVRRRRRRWALSLTAIIVLAAGGVAAGILLQPQPAGLQDPVYGNTETLGFSF